ncbi:MAG: PIG-L family deacetylase [Actinobacteria bacterium]|nr:PIG-L family deacetylase [Actinomycetota bacterium]
MKIIAIGAHPDDIEFMCGGTLAYYAKNNASIYNLVLSNGELCHNAKVRCGEAEKAAKVLGVKKVCFGKLEDGKILHNIETIRLIEDFIKEIEPDLIFTHTPQDRHQDHRNAGRATISAARNHCNILFCEAFSSITPFENFIFVEITKTINKKLKALSIFKSHLELKINMETVKSIARYNGFRSSVEYAEIFQPYRYLISPNSVKPKTNR